MTNYGGNVTADRGKYVILSSTKTPQEEYLYEVKQFSRRKIYFYKVENKSVMQEILTLEGNVFCLTEVKFPERTVQRAQMIH